MIIRCLARDQKSTQAEIQNYGGSLGLVISLKSRSRLSYLIKKVTLMFSFRQYCPDFTQFSMIDSKFHFPPTFTSFSFERELKMILFKTHDIIHPCQM